MKTLTVNLQEWFRSAIRGKTRIGLAWVFAIWLVLSAKTYPNALGVLICLFGAWIRFWGSGFLRKDSKPAVGGPYAHTRNPLYLGTYLMGIGCAIAISNWIFALTLSIVYALVYQSIIQDEEDKLKGILGKPYLRYLELVPRFFPRLIPAQRTQLQEVNSEEAHFSFSWELAMRNKAYEAFAAAAAMIGFLGLVAYLWQRFA